MGKTIEQIRNDEIKKAGVFAVGNETWKGNIYAVVFSTDNGVVKGFPVKDNIKQGLPRLIPNADKPEWFLFNADLTKYVYWGVFDLDSIVTMPCKHQGRTIEEISKINIGFLKWGINDHHKFYLTQNVIDFVRKNKLELSEEDILLNEERLNTEEH